MTERTGFVPCVKPERVDEYVEAHRAVWPENEVKDDARGWDSATQVPRECLSRRTGRQSAQADGPVVSTTSELPEHGRMTLHPLES
jgi:hypothetical protein